MKLIDILTIALVAIFGGYSLKKTYLTIKREKNNQCYRCGISLEGSEVNIIRDGQSTFTMKDHMSCKACLNKTKSRTKKLFIYMLLATVVAAGISIILGN